MSITTYTLYPGQYVDVAVNSTDQLPTGTTLSGTPTSSAVMLSGLDIASNCLNGAPVINGTNNGLLVPIKGSLDWCNYIVTVVCPTTDSKIITTHTFQIQCRAIPSIIS